MVNLDFHLQKKTQKTNPQCYRNPFGNNIFLSLLSTFQQSLTATVPRSCLHPALKGSWGTSVPASCRKSTTASCRDWEKQTKGRIFSCMQGNVFSKPVHIQSAGTQHLGLFWRPKLCLQLCESSFVPLVLPPRIRQEQNAKEAQRRRGRHYFQPWKFITSISSCFINRREAFEQRELRCSFEGETFLPIHSCKPNNLRSSSSAIQIKAKVPR